MFSHNDIYSLLHIRNTYTSNTFLNNLNTYGDALFVAILVANQAGTPHSYAIKIKDFQAFETAMNQKKSTNRKWSKFGDEIVDKFKADANGFSGTAAQYQKAFLELVQSQSLGLDLYEMEKTNAGTQFVQETWKKLTIDANGNIIKTPCN